MANITSKELTAIEEQLSSEQVVIAKYKMYAQTATDTAIRDKFNCIADKHQKHFDTLLSQLTC